MLVLHLVAYYTVVRGLSCASCWVSVIVCGGVATDVAVDVAWRVRLCLDCGALSLVPTPRSPCQEGQAAGSFLAHELLCVIWRPSGVLTPMPWQVRLDA